MGYIEKTITERQVKRISKSKYMLNALPKKFKRVFVEQERTLWFPKVTYKHLKCIVRQNIVQSTHLLLGESLLALSSFVMSYLFNIHAWPIINSISSFIKNVMFITLSTSLILFHMCVIINDTYHHSTVNLF